MSESINNLKNNISLRDNLSLCYQSDKVKNLIPAYKKDDNKKDNSKDISTKNKLNNDIINSKYLFPGKTSKTMSSMHALSSMPTDNSKLLIPSIKFTTTNLNSASRKTSFKTNSFIDLQTFNDNLKSLNKNIPSLLQDKKRKSSIFSNNSNQLKRNKSLSYSKKFYKNKLVINSNSNRNNNNFFNKSSCSITSINSDSKSIEYNTNNLSSNNTHIFSKNHETHNENNSKCNKKNYAIDDLLLLIFNLFVDSLL